ncbi:MAG: SbcC/MukB-like Walker B domain-containing protein, partial [Bdellovibrionales bacterium]
DWTEATGRLTYNLENDDSVWDKDAIEEISQSESSQVLAEGENWSRHAMFVAQSLASDLNARARTALEEAATLHTESNQRREEAAQLRAGKLLPLPRPAWCEEGDDSIALGSALDWKDSITSAERDLLEATFAASGLLGASLGHEGAATGSWRVEPSGPKVSPNLLEVLSVDPGHDFAKEAAAVLERIQLVSSLTEAKSDSLTFAKDGTFQAGVLRARVPGADDPAKLEVASHVGARQRKEAALARAIHLEAEAKGLETSAATLELTAHNQKNEAQAFITAADAFPSVSTLRSRESQRANLADLSKEAREKAEEAAFKTDDLHGLYKRAEAEWVERVRGLGLPRSLNELKELKEKERERADALSAASRVVSERLYKRLERILSRHSELKSNESAKSAQNQAIASERSASDARTSVETLEKNAGAAIKDVLRQLSELDRKVSQAQAKLDSLRSEKLEQVKKHASAITQHDNAKNRYEEEKPTEARTVGALRDVVALPGIVEVLLTEEPLSDDKEFLEQVEAKLAGKKTVSNKTVRTSVDNLKSKLAGRWGIDPGESHPELLTYVLTHRDTSYTPASAAAHAESLRTRAQEALDAQEQKALMDFVLGRLPMAISVAWHQLHDWTREVNRKMRETTASSGVGVQVRTPLRDDMEGPSREVYDLCCRISDVERTPEQQARLANALKALIYSSPGETMLERVTSAVNISEWVDVIYEVTRPGGKIQRWGSKTGLSSGEKRLVVLAPMLAAIAASYDRLGEGVLRIVALDEVPTEVDEKGKEGLARYIAQLDLDLICTSYLWDGCPGAWDGIDAYDLEEGPDGTVVGYPMLVRGLIPLPGDKYYLGSHEPVGTTPL